MTSTRRFDVRLALALGFLAAASLLAVSVILLQPAGVDFLAIWAGGKAASLDVSRIYDFAYVSELQGWPLGHAFPRPFAYPPTALLIFAPLAALPWQVAYAAWIGASALLLAWAGRRWGAPIWFLLVPWVGFAAYCGQATLALSALILLGLSERKTRPIVAGVLFGVVAALKPQLMVLAPFALLAEGRFRVLLVAGAAGLAVCAASLAIWGLEPWQDWLAALPRFSALIADQPRLTANSVTLTSALHHLGLDGRWALLLAPPAAAAVWFAFRRGMDRADELIVLMGATLFVSPYAMHYELALLAPAVAIYLARTQDRRWSLYLAACALHTVIIHPAAVELLALLALPLIRRLGAGEPQVPE